MAEENAVSLTSIAKSQQIPAKEFSRQYKDHISDFHDWGQKDHCKDWMVFPENIGSKLSIDEVSVSNDELYTIITNKAAKGKKGAIVAMVAGIKADDVVRVLGKIPLEERKKVIEVTLDMSNSMDAIVRRALPNAKIVTDRFHVQQLIAEAVQEIRIEKRKEAKKEENEAIQKAKEAKQKYEPKTYVNGDTKKQLLARSRGLLFKPENKRSERQSARATILFAEFEELKEAYNLSMCFRSIYEHSKTREEAKNKLDKWYEKVEEKNIESFNIVAESIRLHETTILNYFPNRSTNASAESFNAKLKGFRSLVRGVKDLQFFLFRVSKIYG